MKKQLFVFILLISIIGARNLVGQNISFLSPSNSPIILNPGLLGVFGGETRISENFRNAREGNRSVISSAFENKIYLKKLNYLNYLTIGVIANYENYKIQKMTSSQIGLPVSLTMPLSYWNRQFFTIGINSKFCTRAFNANKVILDREYIDNMFDPEMRISMLNDLKIKNLSYFDLDAGINYRVQPISKNSKIDLGISISHLTMPKQDFWEGNTNIRQKRILNSYMQFACDVKKINISGQFIFRKIGNRQQSILGGGLRYYFNKLPYRNFSIQIGGNYNSAYYRSFSPFIEIRFHTYRFFISHDIYPRGLEYRGNLEVALSYNLFKSKPLSKFKSCPLI